MKNRIIGNEVAFTEIAVIVAQRNEGSHLEGCVESLLKSSQKGSEIIVVDDGSMDGSLEILRKFEPQIRVIEERGLGPGHARNVAMKATSRPWVAFTDADCEVAADWLAVLCEEAAKMPENVVAVGGAQRVSRRAGRVEADVGRFLETVGFVSDYVHGGSNVREVSHNPTCNVMYLKDALLEVGGFDESLWPCEDLDLDLRLAKLGKKSFFTPRAVVEHRRPSTYFGFFRMMKRYGFAHAQLVKKHGFCQPIHLLALLPLYLALASYGFCWYPKGILHFHVIALAAVMSMLMRRTRSIWRGIRYSGLALATALFWVAGFYSGLLGGRRIARTHA